jgi:cytosine/uracil/thiamine/allantoin permease
MADEIVELKQDLSNSPLYSEDLAPVPQSKRTWSVWDMSAIWVGMAVCIPTYLLASYMIKSGLSWLEALIIILLGNIIITIPMILNGHAGVKYGIPFPVIGRAAFGTRGIHIASVVRGFVACGWFGIQTWIGGLAFYAIWHAVMGTEASVGLDAGKFIGFALFWILNVLFIWNGTESIKWLEKFAAPILIGIGILLIVWGAKTAGGFGIVLKQSDQLAKPSATITYSEKNSFLLSINPILDKEGQPKAEAYQATISTSNGPLTLSWIPINANGNELDLSPYWQEVNIEQIKSGESQVLIKLNAVHNGKTIESSQVAAVFVEKESNNFWKKTWSYLLWLTAMVGFWATMAISIADITRYTATQRNQVVGQFIGLPGTMFLFSFVGIFVTCAALINFQDILIADDAPWDPVSLLGKFENPLVVIIAQIFMIIATLSTNIAANVIAPANAFSNIVPSKISFRWGGIIAATIGILTMPWWLLDWISSLLIFVSGFLGPVLGILICDYFIIRKKELNLEELFNPSGIYSYTHGFNLSAIYAFAGGILVAMIGLLFPSLRFLYTLSWFTGFTTAFLIYYFLMKKKK